MKKKTRDLKKHYRYVERELRNFNIDLSEDSWYGMWHIHLDWDDITSVSEKHRKIHLLYYLKMIEKAEMQANESKRRFQTWIYLDGYEGSCDAIYFHTENPEVGFPYRLDNVSWNVKTPKILLGLLDQSKFNIGTIKDKRDNVHSYIIQRKGLGLKITNYDRLTI